MHYEKLAKLLENEEFSAKLFSIEKVEEVQAFLRENGVALSPEEILAWAEDIREANKQGELAEDDLDAVAGGLLHPFRPGLGLIPVPKLPGPWKVIW